MTSSKRDLLVWLRWLLHATALTLPFIAATQFFAYPAVILTLWLLFAKPELRRCCSRIDWIAPLLFVGLCLGSLAWGTEGVRGAMKIHRLFLFLLIPSVAIAFSGRSILPLVVSLIGGGLLSALRDAIRIPIEISDGTTLLDTGSMTTPQFYLVGLLLLLAIPRGSWPFRLAQTYWGWLLIFIPLGFGLLIHFKRGTWIAFALSIIALAILRKKAGLCWALLLGGILLLALPATRNRIADMATVFNQNKGDRAAIWSEIAPKMLADHPWGYGYKSLRHEDLLSYTKRVQPRLNHLHNNALQMIAELGWLGGVFWLTWMLTALGRSVVFVRRISPDQEQAVFAGVAVAFLGLLLNGAVEYNFGDTEITILFLLLLGMIAKSAFPSLDTSPSQTL